MPLSKASESVGLAGASAASVAWKMGSIVLGWLASLIAPVQPFLISIAVLVVCDVVTGIWAARKRGELITSAKMARTVPKIILYPLGILISELMVKTYFGDTPVVGSLTYMVALFISTVEFQSNIENIGHITGMNIWKHIKVFVVERVKGMATKK